MKSQGKQQSGELLQYVSGSIRQKPYMRRRPWTYDLPKKKQRQSRADFGKIAHLQGLGRFGKQAIVDRHGMEKEIPASAVPIVQHMKPAPPEEVEAPAIPMAERIKRLSEILGQLQPAT